MVSPISKTLLAVDDNLQGVLGVSTDFESQVVASRDAIAEVIQKLPGWIDLASVLLTLIFVWLVLAQGSLLLLAYAYIHTGELRVRFGKIENPGDETLLESENEDDPIGV